MKNIIFTSLIMMMGCSQVAEQTSFSGHQRVSYLEEDELRPKFYYKKRSPQRSPASFKDKFVAPSSSIRSVYFQAMWSQKKDIEKILGKSSDNYCPAFHHQVLGFKENTNSYFSISEMTRMINNNQNPLTYPVLALPYSGSDLYSHQRSEELTSEEVTEALDEFYKLTKMEINDLCETGVSQGYFMTKNLADYYTTDPKFKKSNKYIEAMLKTPFVANMYVLNSFKKSKIGLSNTNELLYHLDANWFVSYLDTMNTDQTHRFTKNENTKH